MQQYQAIVTNSFGNPESGVTVTVYMKGSTTVSPIVYSDNGVTPISAVLTSGVGGLISFYCGNGQYDLVTTATTNVPASTKTISLMDFSQPATDNTPAGSVAIGTTTNDSAQVGAVGEYMFASTSRATATVTITIAAPGVVTWTTHGLNVGSIVVFTTTGALPTGLTAGTAYYIASVIDANTFTVAATPGGTAITTSGTQSGVQTGTSQVSLSTGTTANIAGLFLTPGDWDVEGIVTFATAVNTSVTQAIAGVSTTSATLGSDGTYCRNTITALVPGAVEWLDQASPVARVSLASSTAVYLVGQSTFTVSTQVAGGVIRARRVR